MSTTVSIVSEPLRAARRSYGYAPLADGAQQMGTDRPFGAVFHSFPAHWLARRPLLCPTAPQRPPDGRERVAVGRTRASVVDKPQRRASKMHRSTASGSSRQVVQPGDGVVQHHRLVVVPRPNWSRSAPSMASFFSRSAVGSDSRSGMARNDAAVLVVTILELVDEPEAPHDRQRRRRTCVR